MHVVLKLKKDIFSITSQLPFQVIGMIAVTFLIGVPLASPAVTMEDHVGVTTTVLLSAGASMVIREKTVRYLLILPPAIQV